MPFLPVAVCAVVLLVAGIVLAAGPGTADLGVVRSLAARWGHGRHEQVLDARGRAPGATPGPVSTSAPSTRAAVPTAAVGTATSTSTSAPSSRAAATRGAKKGASIWKSGGAMARGITDSGASWFYTWGPGSNGVKLRGVDFVPMIWGASSVNASTLATVRSAGHTLLGFNEPDLAGQSGMSVETALDLWPQLQKTGMRLGAPAVAYGADTAGGWLDRFMSGAAKKGYRVDFIPLHWYGGDFSTGRAVDQLRAYLEATHARYHKPVWLTEYALMSFGDGAAKASPAEEAAFVTASTKMLEHLAFVERYAWFSLPTPSEGGDGTGLYRPDGTRTLAGRAYRAAGR